MLNFPKQDFADCKAHNGQKYDTFEEALAATGILGRDEEADAVLEEMVDLRYTGAQLRFAFLILLQQDARPAELYRKYEKHLAKDFRDRGLARRDAENRLRSFLRGRL